MGQGSCCWFEERVSGSQKREITDAYSHFIATNRRDSRSMHSICFEQAFHTAHFYYILSSCLVYSNCTVAQRLKRRVFTFFSAASKCHVKCHIWGHVQVISLVTDQVLLTELALWHVLFDMFVSLIWGNTYFTSILFYIIQWTLCICKMFSYVLWIENA